MNWFVYCMRSCIAPIPFRGVCFVCFPETISATEESTPYLGKASRMCSLITSKSAHSACRGRGRTNASLAGIDTRLKVLTLGKPWWRCGGFGSAKCHPQFWKMSGLEGQDGGGLVFWGRPSGRCRARVFGETSAEEFGKGFEKGNLESQRIRDLTRRGPPQRGAADLITYAHSSGPGF